jgi:phosphatidylglycerophosphate synthase
MNNNAKSIFAIVAGFFSIVVLSIGADQLMRVLGIFPKAGSAMTSSLFLLATGYRILISIFGCYLTARLAPSRPVRHALWLGAIGALFSAIGVAAAVKRPELGPLWYPIALLVVALPASWIGGILGQKRIGTAD